MTRDEQIAICRQCTNRKMSDEGLICKLTNAKATFQDECADFEIIPALKPITREKDDGWEGWKKSMTEEKRKNPSLIRVIFYFALGILLSYASIKILQENADFRNNNIIETTAVITEIDRTSGRRSAYFVRVRYTVDAVEHNSRAFFNNRYRNAFSVGSKVQIYYGVKNPDNIRLADANKANNRRNPPAVPFLLLGVLTIVISVFEFFKWLRFKKQTL